MTRPRKENGVFVPMKMPRESVYHYGVVFVLLCDSSTETTIRICASEGPTFSAHPLKNPRPHPTARRRSSRWYKSPFRLLHPNPRLLSVHSATLFAAAAAAATAMGKLVLSSSTEFSCACSDLVYRSSAVPQGRTPTCRSYGGRSSRT
jgi:hypothetical protein